MTHSTSPAATPAEAGEGRAGGRASPTTRRSRAASGGQPKKRQQADFLAHVRDGKNRCEAAELVGSTGSRFRSLAQRDAAFGAAFEAALEAGQPAFVERLDEEWRHRAETNDRLFLVRLEAFHPALEYRRSRHSKVEHAGSVLVGMLDVSRLSDEELETLIALHTKGRPDGATAGAVAVPNVVELPRVAAGA